jgi:hypothetical protein
MACYGEAIPCFAAEQGILSKPLGLLREMTVRPAKTVKKDQNQQISLFFSLYSGNPGDQALLRPLRKDPRTCSHRRQAKSISKNSGCGGSWSG